MKEWKRSALVLFVLLMLFGSSAVNPANAGNAVIVSDVIGFRDYVPMNNSFTHGSTLKVYTEMSNVNYDGFVFVEFVFIIKDPRGHVVSMDRVEVERRDYDNNVYLIYTKEIPSWWLYGKYDLDVFAYNRLDKAKINELERKAETSTPEKLLDDGDFDDLEDFFETASGGDEDDLEDLGVLKSFSDSIRETTHLRFFLLREEEIKPAKLPEAKKIEKPIFTVTNVERDIFTAKPGETVSISVTVKNTGIGGTEKVTLVINGEKEAEESVTLGYMESKTVIFHVKKDLPGTYKVTIPGSDIVTLFIVEESRGEEGTGNSTTVPSESKVSETRALLSVIAIILITLFRFHFYIS